MPNLLAEREICPELIQEAATPDAIAQAIVGLLLEPDTLATDAEGFTGGGQTIGRTGRRGANGANGQSNWLNREALRERPPRKRGRTETLWQPKPAPNARQSAPPTPATTRRRRRAPPKRCPISQDAALGDAPAKGIRQRLARLPMASPNTSFDWDCCAAFWSGP